jgi:hypothetical protein
MDIFFFTPQQDFPASNCNKNFQKANEIIKQYFPLKISIQIEINGKKYISAG